MLRLYGSVMKKHPFLTQCVTSGCLTALGDAISQVVIVKKEKFNYRECFRYFCVGSFYMAPVLRTWYIRLDKIVPPGSKMRALKKVFFDQAIFAPPFIASILSLLRLLDGNSPHAIYEALKRDYTRVVIANWEVWPFVQMVNFYYVPLNYQVVLVNAVSVVWNVFIAYVAEQKTPDDKAI